MKKHLLFTILAFSFIFSNAQSLNGTYTIDPSLPAGNGNYQSFSSLATDLNTFGISGAVDVQVAAGTYNDTLYLDSIPGSSTSNTITIDGQDSSLTTLSWSVAYPEATVSLVNTDHLILKNLSIINTDSSTGTAIKLVGGCMYNTISNNYIQSSYAIKVLPNPVRAISNKYNIIANNKITAVDVGIYLNGYYSASSIDVGINNKIINNRISYIPVNFPTFTGIVCEYQDSLEVLENIIQSDNMGASISSSTNTIISRNSVFGGGIAFDGGRILYSTSFRKTRITNNIIKGILEISYTNSAEILHNSVYLDYELFSSAALTIKIYDTVSVVGGFDIRNNIFSSKKSPAVKTNVGDSIFSNLDNNLYYSGSSLLFNFGSSYFPDLASYKMVSPQFNASSIEVDPNFFSDTSDLYLLKSYAYDKGDGTVGITQDIDGDARPFPGSHQVDIGADEFMPINFDAKATAWQSKPFCSGINQPFIKISNLGADTIHSLWLVYSFNGIWDSVFSAANIPPSEDLDILLNPFNFIADSAYQLVAYTKLPNGMPDGLPLDDTIKTEVRTGLAGVYTIDSSQVTASTNFQSFEDLASVLNRNGLCGATTVNVVPGSGPYNNQIWFNAIAGISSTNTLTINGNGETVQHRTTGTEDERGVFNFKNTSYLTMDSVDIYLNNNGYDRGVGVHILNDCHHISIKSCNITIDSADYTINITNINAGILVSDSFQIIARVGGEGMNSTNAHALTLTNNTIDGGEFGICFRFRPGSLLSDPTALSKNNVVSNNTITNISNTGILLTNHDSLLLESNDISRITGSYGILWHGFNSLINKNIVHNCTPNSISLPFYPLRGKYDSTMVNSFVVNNLISDIKSYSSVMGLSGMGSFYNNTIQLYDSSFYNYTKVAGLYIPPHAEYLNNNISIIGNGISDRAGILLESRSMNIPYTSDYNNVHIAPQGSGPKYYGAYLSNPNLRGFTSLSSWQSNSGQDMNSLNVDPQFVNPSMADFTPQNMALNGSALALPQVPEDLFGNPRGNNPDIGAIEFGNPVGIMEKDGSTIILFPNPSQGKFTLVVTPNKKEKFSLSLCDMNGKELFRKEMIISHSKLESLDFSDFPKGLYLLKIKTEDEMKTEKLIIQ